MPCTPPDTAAQIARYSPSGRVPVLLDGDLRIWESLAIGEYLAERYPAVWPAERRARALARSVSSEMHAGFAALRGELPFNCRARRSGVTPSPAARADIGRVVAIWETCRAIGANAGPWLFGGFTCADAMFAPVALRFHTYGVVLPETAQAYVATVLDDAAVRAWIEAARQETGIIPEEERGQPI